MIQQAASDKVHEESYDGWTGAHVRIMLETIREALWEIYVAPEELKARRKSVSSLRDEISAKANRQPRAAEPLSEVAPLIEQSTAEITETS